MMSNKNETDLLFLGHVPPPNHGAAMIGQSILDHLSTSMNVRFIRISNSKTISDIGRINYLTGVVFLFKLYCVLFWVLVCARPKKIYLTPSLNGFAFLRDLMILSICYLYHKLTSAQIICHIHMRPLFLLKYKLFMWLWNLLSNSFEIILLSNSLINDFNAGFTPKKLHIVPNSVKPINQKSKKENNIDERKIVLFLGHITKEKGAFRLLELARSYQNDSVEFHFAGEFGSLDDEANFYNLASDKLNVNIYYHGRVELDTKENLLNSASVLALPSFSEAQPLTILEAYSCGLPVVATPVGGIVDMLDNNTGRCVDFREFHHGINAVLNLGRDYFDVNCKKKYLEFFSQNEFYAKLDDLFCINN